MHQEFTPDYNKNIDEIIINTFLSTYLLFVTATGNYTNHLSSISFYWSQSFSQDPN